MSAAEHDATAKTSVFIDGGSFVDGLRGHGYSIDLDFYGLIAAAANIPPAAISSMRFYMARYPDEPYPQKLVTQQKLFGRLREQGVDVIEGILELRLSRFVEAGVEAALATDLVAAALSRSAETVVIVSRRPAFHHTVRAAVAAGCRVHAMFFRCSGDPDGGEWNDVASDWSPILHEDIVRFTRSGPIPKPV